MEDVWKGRGLQPDSKHIHPAEIQIQLCQVKLSTRCFISPQCGFRWAYQNINNDMRNGIYHFLSDCHPPPPTGLITFTWKARWDEAFCSFVPKTYNIDNILNDFQMISKVVFFSFPFCSWIWEVSWFYLKNDGVFQREEEMERVSFKSLNVLIHQCQNFQIMPVMKFLQSLCLF